MSENVLDPGVDFDALETKVNRAVELIRRLKEENRRLSEENAGLRSSLDASGGATREALDTLNNQVATLEKEKSSLQDERRLLARRIEAALSKLEFLESESVPH